MNACTLVVGVLLGMGAIAQTEPGVTGSGVEQVKVMPTALRVVIALQAEGDAMDAAIAESQKKADEATKKLTELKPVAGTLVAEGPYTGAATEQEQMMRRMMGGSRGRQAGEEATGKVKLTTTVRATWALSSTDPASLLREADQLRQAVEKAVPAQAVPAGMDEEAGEEMRMMMEATGSEAAMPGRPQLVFVGTISDEALAKARREAFLKATQDATATAQAAGLALGPLRSVQSHLAAPGREAGSEWLYAMRMMGLPEPMAEKEAVSETLRPLTFTVSVTATFGLGPGN